MNKQIMIVVVIALVLLGGGAFAVMNMNKQASPGAGSESSTTTGARVGSDAMAAKTLKDLILGGVAQKCTFSQVSDGTSIDGVTYVSGGKVRGDYNTTTGTTVVNGHMIADGTTNYVWMDGQPSGFMMSFDINKEDLPQPQGEEGSAASQGLDMNLDMNYECSPWVVDEGMFVPPSDVSFTDFSAMIQPSEGTGAAPDGEQSIPNACAACDSLSGEAQTQCLTALNCN